VRHVYGTAAKPQENYLNIRLGGGGGDANLVKANTSYFGITVSSGGGSLAIVDYNNTGRLPAQPAVLDGHKGPVIDFDFNPFHEGIVASGGDDAVVKVWGIPPDGLTENSTDALVDLHGHLRKINGVRFHPTAEHVLATMSYDKTIKVWDIEKETHVSDISAGEVPLDLIWNYNGSLLLGTFKDKKTKIFDPRTGEETSSVVSSDTPKSSKLCWLGKENKFISTAFTRQSKRQFKIWDPRNLKKPIKATDIDQSAGVLMPFYDEGTKLLFFGSKGASHIKFYEIVDDEPWDFYIGQYGHKNPTKGMAFVPKRACDVMSCEVAKILNLTNTSVDVVRMTIPRTSDLFQEDLFPDCYAGIASQDAESFFDGVDKDPVLTSLNPNKKGSVSKPKANKAATRTKTKSDLQKELKEAQERIKTLEKLLKSKNIAIP